MCIYVWVYVCFPVFDVCVYCVICTIITDIPMQFLTLLFNVLATLGNSHGLKPVMVRHDYVTEGYDAMEIHYDIFLVFV